MAIQALIKFQFPEQLSSTLVSSFHFIDPFDPLLVLRSGPLRLPH